MSRPELLMCPPTHYDVNYVINPWMEGNVHKASKQRAIAQWTSLYKELQRHATVKLIEPQPGSPDMVFTANAGLIHGGSAAISHFQFAERQEEEPLFCAWFKASAFDVWEMPRGTSFEGEGDALFATGRTRLWAGFGFRTSLESHAILRQRLSLEVSSLHLIDPRFYHLDTCFAPLSNGDVMYFPDAFDEPSQRAIAAFYAPERRIVVKAEDALRFACNVVCLEKTLVLNRISDSLENQLTQRGFRVVQVELDEFLKAGGAAKCLVMHLN